MLDISYPVSNGQVQDWDAMESVWDYTFEHVLKLDAAARARANILLTEPPLNPLSNRQDHFASYWTHPLVNRQARCHAYGCCAAQLQTDAWQLC